MSKKLRTAGYQSSPEELEDIRTRQGAADQDQYWTMELTEGIDEGEARFPDERRIEQIENSVRDTDQGEKS